MPLTFYSISISRPLSVSCLAFFSIFGTTLGISVRASGPIDASSDRDSLKWVIIYHWLHFVAEVLCCWQLWQLCDSGQLQFALLSCFLFFFSLALKCNLARPFQYLPLLTRITKTAIVLCCRPSHRLPLSVYFSDILLGLSRSRRRSLSWFSY